MSWTKFHDCHSGGGNKIETYENIFIEANVGDAVELFKQLFDHDPYNVTCDCCGRDFRVTEFETLEEATASDRNCQYDHEIDTYSEESQIRYEGSRNRYIPLGEYMQRSDVKVVFARSIGKSPMATRDPEDLSHEALVAIVSRLQVVFYLSYDEDDKLVFDPDNDVVGGDLVDVVGALFEKYGLVPEKIEPYTRS